MRGHHAADAAKNRRNQYTQEEVFLGSTNNNKTMKDQQYYGTSRPIMKAKALVSAAIFGLLMYAGIWGAYLILHILFS